MYFIHAFSTYVLCTSYISSSDNSTGAGEPLSLTRKRNSFVVDDDDGEDGEDGDGERSGGCSDCCC